MMMMMMTTLCLLIIVLLSLVILPTYSANAKKNAAVAVEAEEEFFHQRPDSHQSGAGWQEPGLWRPKWIMDRDFFADTEETIGNKAKNEKVVRHDRFFIKLKPDRTIRVHSQKKRPLLEIGNIRINAFGQGEKSGIFLTSSEGKTISKRLFESGDEDVPDSEDLQYQMIKRQQEALLADVDGTWWWGDEAPLPTAQVKIETREPFDCQDSSDDVDNDEEDEVKKDKLRLRHEIRCDWGKLDGYVAKFRVGKIFKSKTKVEEEQQAKSSTKGKGSKIAASLTSMGSYACGRFTLTSNAHRPLVSKDFMAFQ